MSRSASKKYYEGCATLADMARKAASMEGVDFLSFRMEGGDPNGANKSTEELIGELKEIADAVDLPLVVCGCKNVEKDAELFSKAAEALNGKNAVILSAKEENYKTVGAAAGLAYKQIVGAESAVDINLAKQLNVLISQLGVDSKSVVMNVGSAAVGYGFEYVISTMDRVKAAALQQGDANLQMPIITPVASEAWGVKEAMASETDAPEWGSLGRTWNRYGSRNCNGSYRCRFQCGNPETSGIHQDHFWSDERISLRVALRRRCNYGT